MNARTEASLGLDNISVCAGRQRQREDLPATSWGRDLRDRLRVWARRRCYSFMFVSFFYSFGFVRFDCPEWVDVWATGHQGTSAWKASKVKMCMERYGGFVCR